MPKGIYKRLAGTRHSIPLIERFEKNIERITECGCWIWMLHCSPKGYGRITPKSHVSTTAHRISWNIFNGEIPVGMCVLHRCDTPSCVNPHHLFLGTYTDNNIDRVIKKRSRNLHGDSSPLSKVTAKQVVEMRASKNSQLSLSKKYSLSTTEVCRIINRKVWRSI